MGFVKGKASPCCFYNKALDARCVVHGDDFTFEGTDDSLNVAEKGMTKAFECKVEGRLGGGKSDKREVKILNRIMTWRDGEVTWEADPRHAEALIRDLGVQHESVLTVPGSKPPKGKEEEEEDLGEEEQVLYRSGAAKANYLAQDRPDISFAAKECCRHMASPKRKHWEALKRIARYLKGEPRKVYRFRRQEGEQNWDVRGYSRRSDQEEIKTYSDTDFAGCVDTRKSTAGGCLMVNGHLIKHWSSTLKTIALSSGEAELAGIVKAAGESLGLRSLCEDLGLTGKVDLYADSSAAIGICQRSGIGRVRHLDVAQLWIQERIRAKEFGLHKWPGADNPADILTKHVCRAILDSHLETLCIDSIRGRADIAPDLI